MRIANRVYKPSVPPPFPRLLDLHGAAQYLCLSEWAVRDLESAEKPDGWVTDSAEEHLFGAEGARHHGQAHGRVLGRTHWL